MLEAIFKGQQHLIDVEPAHNKVSYYRKNKLRQYGKDTVLAQIIT